MGGRRPGTSTGSSDMAATQLSFTVRANTAQTLALLAQGVEREDVRHIPTQGGISWVSDQRMMVGAWSGSGPF